MTPTLIVLAFVALGVIIVVLATRKKSGAAPAGPQEGDTAWNDPVTPGEPARPERGPDTFAVDTPPSRDPRP